MVHLRFIFDSSQSKCFLRIQSSSSLSHLPKGRVFLLQTRVSLTGVRGGVGFGLKVNNNGRAPLVPSATTDYCTAHAIVVPPNLTPNDSPLPQTTTEPHCQPTYHFALLLFLTQPQTHVSRCQGNPKRLLTFVANSALTLSAFPSAHSRRFTA